jgi:hypothetical protein
MRKSLRLSLAFLAFVLAGGCGDDPTPPETRVAGQLGVFSGDAQTATVGQRLAQPLTVQVLDDRGAPMPGQTIAFIVTMGGGSLDATSGVTDAEGKTATRWTLGMTADTQLVIARLTRTERPPLVAAFRAKGRAAAPASVERFGVAAPSGPAGAVMVDPRSVRVLDAFGNPVPGVPVTWQVTSGGGTAIPLSATTGSDGIATARWALGPRWGAVHQLRATTPVGTIDFAANATLPPDAVIQAAGGSGQTGKAGAPLADSLVARIVLADGRPLQGVVIEWLVASNQGTVSPPQGTTDEAGLVRARWTLPATAGPASIAAKVQGAAAMVHFTATAVAGQVANQEVVGSLLHTGPAGGPVAQTVAVRLRDALGNPVPGAAAEWRIMTGGGTVEVTPTDAQGISTAR